MRGRHLTALLLLAAAGAAALASCRWLTRSAPPPTPRGIVLVLAQGLEPGSDPAQTPHLARLASAGRSFEQAFAPGPDPTAARAAVLGAPARSLAALFRARGAAVAAVGGLDGVEVGGAALDATITADAGSAAATGPLDAWLRARRGCFLVLAALTGGAVPSVAPAPEAGRLAAPLPLIATDHLDFLDRPGGAVRPPAWSVAAREHAATVALERAIAADAALGRLAALVADAAPGSALVVVGDPPADRGAHGIVKQPGLFDDTLRSTLVVSTPGLSRPGRAARLPVSTRDVAPTLLALAGLPPEPGLQGRSLLPLLADPSAEGAGEALSSVERRAGRVGRSARTARWRFTEWPDGSAELYDHDADPREITNLAGRPEQRATVAELRRALDAPAPPETRSAAVRGRAPRNVLLLIVDDLNTRVGAWGAPVQTPNIDRLARAGVRFDHAYVAVAMCSPSRVSMMTGWRPARTGVWNNLDPPRPEGSVPLEEHFGAHGFVSAAIGKLYHFPEQFRWDVREEHPAFAEDEGEAGPRASGDGPTASGEGLWVAAPGGDLDQPDGKRARRAAQLLARYHGRPFFLALGLVRPHVRWIAPARYFGLYPPEAITPVPYPADDLADVPAIAIKTRPQPLPGLPLLGREPPGLVSDPAVRRQAIAAYQACTTFADAQVGVVLAALDRLDLWRSTVVVLVGDNGFHLGEHGGLLRKDTLFEEGLHVPLIVVAPGLPRPGAVVRAPVEVSDLYPTIVELAGLPAVPGLDARSLVPLLDDPDRPGRGPALSYRRVQPSERGFSIRTERLRYTLWPDGSEELYDVRADPAQSENVASRPERAADKARLRSRIEALVAVSAPRTGGH